MTTPPETIARLRDCVPAIGFAAIEYDDLQSIISDAERVGELEKKLAVAVEALEVIATCVTTPIHRDYLSIDRAKEYARTALAKIREQA
jgi:hypothetical protein